MENAKNEMKMSGKCQLGEEGNKFSRLAFGGLRFDAAILPMGLPNFGRSKIK